MHLAGLSLSISWPTLSHRAKENCNGKGYLRYIDIFSCENLGVYKILHFHTRNWKNGSKMFFSINKQVIILILAWIHSLKNKNKNWNLLLKLMLITINNNKSKQGKY